jgi:hypothetical protein
MEIQIKLETMELTREAKEAFKYSAQQLALENNCRSCIRVEESGYHYVQREILVITGSDTMASYVLKRVHEYLWNIKQLNSNLSIVGDKVEAQIEPVGESEILGTYRDYDFYYDCY